MEKESIKNLEVHKGNGLVKKTDSDTLYAVLDSLPKPDIKMELTQDQVYWWYWFGLEFLSTKQLTKGDLIHLQDAAFWMDVKNKALFKIKKLGYDKGVVQTFPSGASNISGHLTAVEKAKKHLDDISAHFGLSIKDRKKLDVVKGDKDQLSLFEQLLKAKDKTAG